MVVFCIKQVLTLMTLPVYSDFTTTTNFAEMVIRLMIKVETILSYNVVSCQGKSKCLYCTVLMKGRTKFTLPD